MSNKIVSKEEFRNVIRPRLKAEGKTIALCHGVFDLLHPGHIIHLNQARQMADVLVVSITTASKVRKGPGRPYFDDDLRMQTLAALECVDYVMRSDMYTVDDIVEAVEPDFYVKGEEYAKEKEDVTGNIERERELVERHGGRIAYTGGQVFSSTKLINRALRGLPDDVLHHMEELRKTLSMDDVKRYADIAAGLKVLVVGDVIIDKYTYCDIQGLISKDIVYSAREHSTEEYLGGSVAVARHISGFTKGAALLSIVGDDWDEGKKAAFSALQDTMRMLFVRSKTFPTIVKHRYLTENGLRAEYRKYFAVNNIPNPAVYEEEERREFLSRLEAELDGGGYDAVFLCDFGHGLVDMNTMDMIQDKAKYLILNCQTNSTNKGMNPITKYRKANVFCLDQTELKLAYPMLAGKERESLVKLHERLGGQAFLTRGAMGAWALEKGEVIECPALTLTVKDTVGAGDAFYAVAGLYSAAGAPLALSLLMGNIAGALGANIVGNKEAVDKAGVLKYAATLMNV